MCIRDRREEPGRRSARVSVESDSENHNDSPAAPGALLGGGFVLIGDRGGEDVACGGLRLVRAVAENLGGTVAGDGVHREDVFGFGLEGFERFVQEGGGELGHRRELGVGFGGVWEGF